MGSSRRARAAVVVIATAVAAVLGAGWQAQAQTRLLPTTTTTAAPAPPPTDAPTDTTPPPTTSTSTTSTSTTSSTTTTTTTEPSGGLLPRPGAGEPAPGEGGEGSPPPGDDPSGEDPYAAHGDDTEPLPEGGLNAFPEDLRALMNSIQRSGPSSSASLLEALAPLEEYGMSLDEAAVLGFGRFPVAGRATYVHDWWFPRFGPGWRLHQGTDVFAPYGTPVRAPVEGKVRITNGGLGGLSVYVVEPDGTYYYLTHLSGIAPGIVEGASVVTGQVVGYVGDSGNARGGRPHLHIQIHPRGGAPIDPKPILDKFLLDALERAPQLVEAYAARHAHLKEARPAEAVAEAPAAVPSRVRPEAPSGPPRAALLWASSVSPAGGALNLAEAEATRVVSEVDWAVRVADQHSQRADREEARFVVDALLAPLTPPLLRAVLGS